MKRRFAPWMAKAFLLMLTSSAAFVHAGCGTEDGTGATGGTGAAGATGTTGSAGGDPDCAVTDPDCTAACGHGAVTSRCACDGSVRTNGFCCGGTWQTSDCSCDHESETEVCASEGAKCGPVTAKDGCGATRTVECGTCAAPEACGAGGVPSQCGEPIAGDVSAWISALPTLSNGMKWMPGVPGGIPTGTLDTTLTAGQMTTSGINSAIAAASKRGSPSDIRVVQMPAGTFSNIGTITPRNYVILRGAGPSGADRTRLNFNSGGGVQSVQPDWPTSAQDMALSVGGTLPIGSTAVGVGSASAFAVGDLIQLDQLDDLSYVAILDAGYNKRAPFTDGPYNGPISTYGFRSVASVHQVTAIDGTTLTIDPPTRIKYDYFSAADGTTRLRPEVWRVSRRGTDGLWWFGLESMSIAGPQGGAIVYGPGAFDWVKNVETDGSANGGITDDHIRFEHQFRSEMRRVYAHHTKGGPVSGGANYGLNLNAASSECLIIDSIVLFMNKLIQSNACGPGNVIAYNYVDNTSANGGDWMDGAINGSHQSFSHNMLVEGNWAANIGCDTTHGVSGFMAFVRNYAHGRSSVYDNNSNQRAANSDGWQREMAFLGNVLSTASGGVYEQTGAATAKFAIWSIGQNVWGSGDDYDKQTSLPPENEMSYDGKVWDARQATFTTKAHEKLWRHGNWDSVNASIVDWDPALPAHEIAASLFLSEAPEFFGTTSWPWIDPTGATPGDRVKTLPAKARYDAGTPFAP